MKKQLKLILFLMTVLIVPALCQASATILTNVNPNHTITSGNDEQVYGTSTSNQIILESGAKAELVNFPGHNSIQIQSSSDLFTVSRSGTMVTLEGSDGTTLKIPATTDHQSIMFTDNAGGALRIHNGQVMLEKQVIGLSKAPIGQNQDPCTFSLSSSSNTFASSGGTLTVFVNASSSICEWTASESLDWVSLSPSSGTGNGTVTITVTVNTGSTRTGTATLAGLTYSINQDELAPCNYSISPSNSSFNSFGGISPVSVTASNTNCEWTTSKNLDWISLSPTSGTGSETVTIMATENTGSARSGSVTIAGETYEISQSSGDKCGAYVTPDVWKEFDCYNLAAIGKFTGANPFVPSWELNGGYWQWGRKGPDPEEQDWYNTNTKNFAHGPTGPGESDANAGEISGWDNDYAPDSAWSDASKTANDPCPAGYRVPTKTQWEGVLDNNTQTTVGTWDHEYTNYSSALFFGDDLMLPATGHRNGSTGALHFRGYDGTYWSSSERNSSDAWRMYFDNGLAAPYGSDRLYGLSVRCVAE